MKTIAWNDEPHEVDPRVRGNAVRAGLVHPLHRRVRVVEGEQGEQLRELDAVLDLAVLVDAEDVQRRARLGLRQALEDRELGRLVLGHRAGGPVTHEQLRRRGDRRRSVSATISADAVAALAVAAQPARRVHSGDEEAGDDDPGEVHVHELVPHVAR